MHHVIAKRMGLDRTHGKIVHRNGDKRDNRRCNLAICKATYITVKQLKKQDDRAQAVFAEICHAKPYMSIRVDLKKHPELRKNNERQSFTTLRAIAILRRGLFRTMWKRGAFDQVRIYPQDLDKFPETRERVFGKIETKLEEPEKPKQYIQVRALKSLLRKQKRSAHVALSLFKKTIRHNNARVYLNLTRYPDLRPSYGNQPYGYVLLRRILADSPATFHAMYHYGTFDNCLVEKPEFSCTAS